MISSCFYMVPQKQSRQQSQKWLNWKQVANTWVGMDWIPCNKNVMITTQFTNHKNKFKFKIKLLNFVKV